MLLLTGACTSSAGCNLFLTDDIELLVLLMLTNRSELCQGFFIHKIKLLYIDSPLVRKDRELEIVELVDVQQSAVTNM